MGFPSGRVVGSSRTRLETRGSIRSVHPSYVGKNLNKNLHYEKGNIKVCQGGRNQKTLKNIN